VRLSIACKTFACDILGEAVVGGLANALLYEEVRVTLAEGIPTGRLHADKLANLGLGVRPIAV